MCPRTGNPFWGRNDRDSTSAPTRWMQLLQTSVAVQLYFHVASAQDRASTYFDWPVDYFRSRSPFPLSMCLQSADDYYSVEAPPRYQISRGLSIPPSGA